MKNKSSTMATLPLYLNACLLMKRDMKENVLSNYYVSNFTCMLSFIFIIKLRDKFHCVYAEENIDKL